MNHAITDYKHKNSGMELLAKQEAALELKGTLVIYHPGSLSIPFAALEKEFTTLHPKVNIKRTEGGSTNLIRRVINQGDKVDILISADYRLLEDEIIPDYASWYILFANNSLVIMYMDQSKYADQVTEGNWYEILLRDGVNYGHSSPDNDPCGYRSLLCWQLAELYYEQTDLSKRLSDKCPEENIPLKASELISMLQNRRLDYIFEYESVARQHAAANPIIKWLELPEKVNLSQKEYTGIYAQAVVNTRGSAHGETIRRIGEPIIYGITMPRSGENTRLAVEFLKYFLDKEQGLKILNAYGQPVLDQIVIHGEGIPEELQTLMK